MFDIVIINCKHNDVLDDLISSIKQTAKTFINNIIVVDTVLNGIEYIPKYNDVIVVKLYNNQGAAYQQNIGAKLVSTPFFIRMIADTKCIMPDWDVKLVEYMKDKEGVGCIGFRIYEYNDVCTNAYVLDYIDTTKPIGRCLQGNVMVYNKDIWDSVGGYCEDYFLHFDEQDYQINLFENMPDWNQYYCNDIHFKHVKPINIVISDSASVFHRRWNRQTRERWGMT